MTSEERFSVLFDIRLAEIESNFFKSFMLDKNYDSILDMLKNIDMLSENQGTSDLTISGTEEIKTIRTDNLQESKSERSDTNKIVGSTTDIIGAVSSTVDVSNSGTLKNEITYGRKDTASGTDTNTQSSDTTNKSRTVVSNTPQSNLGADTVGIDANLNWDYASQLQDNKNTNDANSTNSTEYGKTSTQSGTDTSTSTDTRGTMTTQDVNEHQNSQQATQTNDYTRGRETKDNTGTQTTDRTNTKNGTNKNVSNRTDNNSGRNTSLAELYNKWRSLLHGTITSYQYLFKNLDDLFMSIWDIEDDSFFTIV